MILTLSNVVGAGTDNGVWTDVEALEVPYTVHFRGAGVGDTYQLYGSNEPTVPSNATDRATIGAAVNTDNALVTVSAPVKWLKAKKTAGTQSSQAYLFGYTHK